jgi:hypothetical protein
MMLGYIPVKCFSLHPMCSSFKVSILTYSKLPSGQHGYGKSPFFIAKAMFNSKLLVYCSGAPIPLPPHWIDIVLGAMGSAFKALVGLAAEDAAALTRNNGLGHRS